MKYFPWLAAVLLLCSFTVAGTILQPAPTKKSSAPIVEKSDTVTLVSKWVVVENGYSKNGNASYYANRFHGRRTSSGAVYHKDSLTAAHRSLKFGTILRVTNLSNDSVVFVKVTDRMGKSPHILDLSYAGAQQLNFVRNGIAKVKIEEVKSMELQEVITGTELTEQR